jgi:hypothetical protein
MKSVFKIKKSNKSLKDKDNKNRRLLNKEDKENKNDEESDDKDSSSDILVKRYKLTKEAINFARGPIFRFRIAFSVLLDTGETTIRPQKKCPVIEADENCILETSNTMAQISIENFILPSRTTRNGDGIQGGNEHAFVELLIDEPTMRVMNLDDLYFNT